MADPISGILGALSPQDQAVQGAETTLGTMFITMIRNQTQQQMQGFQEASGDDPDYPNNYDGF
jgi:hypothetical protein